DRPIGDRRGEHQAGAHEIAVDQDRARAALTLLARALGGLETEPLAQHVQQALADPGVADLVRRSVDVQGVVLAHADSSSAVAPANARCRRRRTITPTACRRYAAVDR